MTFRLTKRYFLILISFTLPLGIYFLGLKPLFVRASETANPVSDDFNQNNLATHWSLDNPVGDGYIEITNVGGDAHLEITAPEGEGNSHNPWDTNNSVRVMQAAANTDFTMTVKIDSVPNSTFEMQGLLVEQDADNWLRFGNHFRYGKNYFFVAETLAGDSVGILDLQVDLSGSTIFLRVARSATTWTYSYSEDGSSWNLVGSFTSTVTVDQIGVFAGNHDNSEGFSPEYTANVDYFEVSNDPISAEDGVVGTDTQEPFIHADQYELNSPTASITFTWHTDEPAIGSLEYGLDLGYGTIVTETGGLIYAHSQVITGLIPGETYHFRLRAKDAGDRWDQTTDIPVTIVNDGPDLSVWYGTDQHFGGLGQPQPWVNIVGNVTDTNEINSFYYSLNEASPVDLEMGPDSRRLDEEGDFNVDIATADLSTGENKVVITAINAYSHTSQVTVTLNYTAGTVWPLPYILDWGNISTSQELQHAAQIVDGEWTLTGDGIRNTRQGYDRLIAIGDRTWTDYIVTVPITVHSSFAYNSGIGLLFRWDGHTDTPVNCGQPKCGWEPLGELAWMRRDLLEFFVEGITTTHSWDLETTYLMKMQVETGDTGSTYSVKVWAPASEAEPVGWDLSYERTDGPANGSFLLLTHQLDSTFGEVYVERIWPYSLYFPLILR